MKLLFVLTYYAPHWTGLTQYAKMLAEDMAKRNHTVTVLTTQFRSDLPEEENINGVRVIRLAPSLHFSRSAFSASLIRKFDSLIQEHDTAACFMPFDSVYFIAQSAKKHKKLLFLLHNGDLVLPGGFTNRALEFAFHNMTGAAIRISSGVIVNTVDYAKNSPLLSKFPHKWIPLVPPITRIPSTNESRQFVRNILPSGNYHFVAFSGRFVEEKGFDILLKAIPLVLEKEPRAYFVFAGEVKIAYENFYALQEDVIRSSQNLFMAGRLPREHMGAFYESCDILAMPSRSDFFPFVQAEAMLSGLPSVVSNIPGARWLVQETGMGLLTEPEDPVALANALLNALAQKENLRSRHHLVEAIFDHQSLISKYENLFLNGHI